ncbi:MAG: methyltransferase domain-containing protein [Sphingobium sp.]|nr:methyltransferase domain-containing protein [Sphingobium sp.]
MSRTERIRAAFGKAAGHYDGQASVQQQVARHVADLAMQAVAEMREGVVSGEDQPCLRNDGRLRILEIGCGTGELTGHIRALLPDADIVATDISPEMIAEAQRKLGDDICFMQMDGENPCFHQPVFDLILSSLCFQWFNDLPAALGRLVHLLNDQGRLIFSTMADRSFIEWRQAHNRCNMIVGTPAYPMMEELAAIMASYKDSQLWEEQYAWDFGGARGLLAHLKAIGATVPVEGRVALRAGKMRQVMRAFDEQGGVCTYHIAYGKIIKNQS